MITYDLKKGDLLRNKGTGDLAILNAKKINAIRTIDDISLIIKFDKLLYFQNIILFNLK